MNSSPTVVVHEKATVRQQPSELMMVAEITASGQTLELALKLLQRKREAVSEWMERLGARDVRFGTPRFPDQVTPSATQMVERMQRRVRQQLGQRPSPESSQDSGRNVVVCFAATWSIAGMSSDEVLILADRIRLEASEPEHEPDASRTSAQHRWSDDSAHDIGEMLTELCQPIEGSEPHFLFLSQIDEECYKSALAEAFKNAAKEAQLLAFAAGGVLGELASVHSTMHQGTTHEHVNQIHRLQHAPILAEVPLQTSRFQQVSESPKPAEFSFSVSATFQLKPVRDEPVAG